MTEPPPLVEQTAVVEALAGVVRDGAAGPRHSALQTLAMLDAGGLKPAAAGLRAAVKDPQAHTRLQAAKLLVKLPGADREAGLTVLGELLTDRTSFVRHETQLALRGLGADGQKVLAAATVEALRDPDLRTAAIADLYLLSPVAARPAAPLLKEMLADPVPQTRLAAAQALARIGGPDDVKAAIAALVELLKDKTNTQRGSAGYALQMMGPEAARAAAPVFREMLADPVVNERLTAAQALVTQGPDDRKAVAPVAGAVFRDAAATPFDRVRAAELLLQADPTRADEVAAGLRELAADARGRSAVVTAVARLGTAQAGVAVPILRAVLTDPGRVNRQSAVNQLGSLGPAAKDAIPDLADVLNHPATGPAAAAALARIGGDAVPVLVKALDAPTPAVRRAAAEGLGECGPAARPAVPVLLKRLSGESVIDHSGVLNALVRIGPAALPDVLAALTGPDEAGRRAAVRVLASLVTGHGDAVGPALAGLEAAAGHTDPLIRLAAARAAYTSGSRARPVLLVLATDTRSGDDAARRETAFACARASGPVPEPLAGALADLLADPVPSVRQYAAAALVASPGACGLVLLDALKDTSTQAVTIYALSRLPGDAPAVLADAAPLVRGVLKVPYIRTGSYLTRRAAVALHKLGGADAAELLVASVTGSPAGEAVDMIPTLRELGPGGTAALRKLAEGDTPALKAAALESLGAAAAGDPALIPVVAAGLNDPTPAMQHNALFGLAAAGPNAKPAADAVAAAFQNTDVHTRAEAAVALAHIAAGSDVPAGVVDALRDALAGRNRPFTHPTRLLEALARCGPAASPAVPDLVAALPAAGPAVRAKLAETLGRIGTPAAAATPALTALLADPHPQVRAHAAAALWRVSGTTAEVVPVLAAALSDPAGRRPASGSPAPASSFHRGIGMIAYRGVPEAPAAPLAARTLGDIGPAAVGAADALSAADADPDPEVRRAAAAALARVRPTPAPEGTR